LGHKQLVDALLPLSISRRWATAKLEWQLEHVYRQDEAQICLCGHYPIVEICVLRNKLNQQSAEVGNVCVKKFLGLPSDFIFNAIRRVSSDEEHALNAETIKHAFKSGWINEWERRFSIDTMRKRSLSERQLAKRI
jgi:hypothetical protein